MQIDPQAAKPAVEIKLDDSDKVYLFKPMSYRQWRAYVAFENNKDALLVDYMDQVFAMLVEGHIGSDTALAELEPMQLIQLLNKRAGACFPSPEDKKKSES